MHLKFIIISLVLSYGIATAQISDPFGDQLADSVTVKTDSTFTDSNSVQADSLLGIPDSLSNVIVDTLKPIVYSGILGSSASFFSISKKELNYEDYRSFGDLSNFLPGGFYENPGLSGHTGEVYFNGLGYQEITAAMDGDNINNRLTNTFNFNNFDYENIKAIEIPSITKGFIYNIEGNPVYLNFVKEDTLRSEPFTRVRYLQGPDDEGLVNGHFARVITGRLSGGFSFSNVQSGQRYENSDAGGWTASANLKYVYSNNLNLFASYNFYNTKSELNGGIDIEQIEALYLPQDYEEVIFNPRAAEVVFPYQSISTRYVKYEGEKYHFRSIARFLGLFYTQLDVDYSYNKIKFRQNERGLSSEFPRVVEDNGDKSYSVTLRQKLTTNIVKLDLIASYRNETIEAEEYPNVVSDNYFLSADALFEPFEFVNVNLFAKLGRYRKYNTNGSGLIATISPLKNFKISAATSYNEQAQPFMVNSLSSEEKPVRNIINEIAVSFKSNNIQTRLSGYTISKDNYSIPYSNGFTDTSSYYLLSGYKEVDYFRIGVSFYSKVRWKFIELFLNPSYNFTEYNSQDKFLPELTFTGGLYYRNVHFNNNLNIKTGFNLRYNSEQLYSLYDYRYNERIYHSLPDNSGNPKLLNQTPISSGLNIDFVVIAELQRAAIVYFAFENILDENHYVLPYYPMYSRGFRIGFNWKLYN
ncbi:MAG: hypothetical protein SCALA702_11820 [Melioribacteraceae bacterium]|nr:MAG: hypothetical protein SCALA702_11820 [Melioribacteraceae bacterium]